jgi:hypothetical protein
MDALRKSLGGEKESTHAETAGAKKKSSGSVAAPKKGIALVKGQPPAKHATKRKSA